VRLLKRLLIAALVAVAPAGIVVASCGVSSVGETACRQIEWTRCSLAPKCETGFDVGECQRFYRDECLVGVQNTANTTDPNSLWQPCVNALNSVASCVQGGSGSALECEQLIPDASCLEVDASANACNIILDCPELLTACSFVGTFEPAADAGDGGDADASEDASDDGDAASTDTDTDDGGDGG
jgi:hypothetical protein